jgi:acyl-CoA reductase-like NAD-dependent aldehyde dehydrogenase
MAEELRNRVAGEWVDSPEWDEVSNPYTGEPVARVPLATAEQMDRAIAASAEGAAAMAELSRYRRAEILHAIARGVEARREELAETITRESGKPIRFSLQEIDRAVHTFTLGAEEARRIGGEIVPVDITAATEGYESLYMRFPVGAIGALSPFNFPVNLTAHKLSPGLAAGNALVVKPPMQAPVSALRLVEICAEAGVPPLALSALHCEPRVAEALATDERLQMVSFTGSAHGGWHLKSVAGRKRVALELGGNAAAIVHEDADLDRVAARVALGAFASAGQVCIRVQRLLVHRPVLDRFLERFLDEVGRLRVGDPLDPQTVVGPMIDAAAADRVMAWIDEARDGGAEALTAVERERNVIRPVVMVATRPEMRVEREEVFGPVVTVRPYDDFDEAIRLTNQGAYGLQAGVFTRDLGRVHRAFRGLQVGGVIVNDYPTLRVDNFPYGGVKESGFGREGVRFAMEEMTEMRALVLNLAP